MTSCALRPRVSDVAVAIEMVLKVAPRDYDEDLLAEVERYSAWVELAEELASGRQEWLVRLT